MQMHWVTYFNHDTFVHDFLTVWLNTRQWEQCRLEDKWWLISVALHIFKFLFTPLDVDYTLTILINGLTSPQMVILSVWDKKYFRFVMQWLEATEGNDIRIIFYSLSYSS